MRVRSFTSDKLTNDSMQTNAESKCKRDAAARFINCLFSLTNNGPRRLRVAPRRSRTEARSRALASRPTCPPACREWLD